MSQHGTIDRWEAEKGFGFIRCEGRSVFFHVRDYRGEAMPRLGEAVTFEEIHVGGKGPRAMGVRPLESQRLQQALRSTQQGVTATGLDGRRGSRPGRRRVAASPPGRADRPAPNDHAALVLALMGAWTLSLGWAAWQQRLPVTLVLMLPLLNVVTFFVYWIDKDAARQGRWRISESTLHGLALLGGWPGAWWAQQLLRHKSVKPAFRAVFWLTVGLNIAGLAAWLQRGRWL